MKSFKEFINEQFGEVIPIPARFGELPADPGPDTNRGMKSTEGRPGKIETGTEKPIPPGWPGPRPESVKVWKGGYGEDAAFWADLDGNGDPDTEIFWDEEGGYWYYIDEVGNHVQVP